MTTQNKKDSVQANDAVAKKPRKPRTKNVDTTVPEVDVNSTDAVVSRSNSIAAFLKTIVKSNLSQTSVHCHSSDVLAINGYNLVVTDIYNEIKEALNNSKSAFYRDIASGSGDFGIVYISTEHGTHLFFLAGANDQPLPENDGNLQQIINLLSSYQGFDLGTIKGKMVNGYLEKANAMAKQKENSNSTLPVDAVENETTRTAFDFVHNATKEALKKHPGLRAYFTHFKVASNVDEWYSVMFTNNFELMADILKSGRDTSFTEGTVKANYPYGIGRVVGIKNRKFVNIRFIVIGIDNQYMPATFSDSEKAFLRQAYTEVKWKIPSEIRTELRNSASRIYQPEDKGIDTVKENQTSNVTELQKQTMDAVMTELDGIFDTPKIHADLKINYDPSLAVQGYNILYTDNFEAVSKTISRLDNLVLLPIPLTDEGCAWKHAAVVVIDTKNAGQVTFYVIEEYKNVAGHTNPNLQEYIDAMLGFNDAKHKGVVMAAQLEFTKKSGEGHVKAANQVSQAEIVDAIRGVIGYDQEDAPLLKNNLCINSNVELANDGYNILFTNDIRIIANIISKSNSMYILPIVKCSMNVAITGIYVGGKFIGLYIVEVIDVSGHVHESDFAKFIHNTLWNGDDVHKPSMTVVKHALDNMLSKMAKNEDAVPVTGDSTASNIPKETQDLAARYEMVDAVMGALGQIESTVPRCEVNLCINRNLDQAEKGYNVLFTNDFKAVINVLDNLKEAGQMPINHADFSAAVAGVYVNHRLIQFYVVEELQDIACVPDDNLGAYIVETLGMPSDMHSKIMEILSQKLGQKFVRRTVQEIDVLEANEKAEREKVTASTERVPSGLGREPLFVEPVANSKQFPPFQPSRKSIIESYRESKLKMLFGDNPRKHYGVLGEESVADYDSRRYNRHTYPNEVSERFSDVRIYDHTPRYNFGETTVLSIIRDFMMKHNMPSIPTRDSLDNGEDQFTRELCRLENGSVVWNRAAMLTVSSCRQNKKEGKGINHYMLSVRDDERREFVICIYADYTNRKRPGFVVNYFEILEGDAMPYVGNVARHLEHVLCQ